MVKKYEGDTKRDSAVDISLLSEVNLNKISKGDAGELNNVVNILNNIEYDNLSNDSKNEIRFILNEMSNFELDGVVGLDSKKVGDMIQAIGADSIDPYMLGMLANYADISGRENVLLVSMAYMPQDKMVDVLDTMDIDTLSNGLEGVLNSSYDREFWLGNKGNIATMFVNSDMNVISNDNIGDMLMYLERNNVPIDQDTIVKIFNKKNVDLSHCFGDKLTSILNELDISRVNFGEKLTKDILKNIDIDKIDAKKLSDMLKRVDIKNIGEKDISLDKVKAVLEKIEDLDDKSNDKFIEKIKGMKSRLAGIRLDEMVNRRRYVKDDNVSKDENIKNWFLRGRTKEDKSTTKKAKDEGKNKKQSQGMNM